MKYSYVMALCAVMALSACSREQVPAPAAAGEVAAPDPAEAMAESGEATSVLAGTAWRLLNISSMDDTIDVPDDPSRYTLEFGADGRASMQADCNRGTGSWATEGDSQLQFGPIAATRALCSPGSLSEKYLAQFEWVRSYVMRDGHLFLATMADGSIIEFEPLPPVSATVLGDAVRTIDPGELQEQVLTRLFDAYAAEKGLAAEESEVDAFVGHMQRGMAAEGLGGTDDLTPEEVAQVEAMRREMGRAVVGRWKLNKALYEQYGGRIIYQQLGPEPLDAYRQFLEERQAAGDFVIEDAAMAEYFWRYFTDESMHDFMEPGSADEARAFASEPWKVSE